MSQFYHQIYQGKKYKNKTNSHHLLELVIYPRTFVLPRDLLPLSALGFSLAGFLSVTTSKTVGCSLIKLNKRFLSSKQYEYLLINNESIF